MTSLNSEEQWIAIQHKTFVNWANDQLSLSNRSVQDLGTDFCDGVKLVALVEVLQLQKIGKVYPAPKGRIQALHNVSLALKAVQGDNVKLVNIGTDDVVGGNLKLTLGLLWHLILRYQISASKSRAPPKKLMLAWFQDALPEITVTNFTSCWNDGVALHALLDYCKPGLSPQWRSLDRNDKVANCKTAMQIAKDQLGVPRVISAEDFASQGLDELSAMTYLSYFIRRNSPGYFGTLNWVCRQLHTANISNLTTDWNDGHHLCALVHSLGGDVTGWPHLDKDDPVATCQKGLDAAERLGVTPILTAQEMADPHVDHLAMMTYVGKLQRVVPRKGKAEKLVFELDDGGDGGGGRIVDAKITFHVAHADPDVVTSKVHIQVLGPTGKQPLDLQWADGSVVCAFTPSRTGTYQIELKYDDVAIKGSPFAVKVVNDHSKVKVTGKPDPCPVSRPFTVKVETPFDVTRAKVRLKNPSTSKSEELFLAKKDHQTFLTDFKPPVIGLWTATVALDEVALEAITFHAYDASKATISAPEKKAIVNQSVALKVVTKGCGSDDVTVEVESGRIDDRVKVEMDKESPDHLLVIFTPTCHCSYQVSARIHGQHISGSPLCVQAVDPTRVSVMGAGLVTGTRGAEAVFRVNAKGMDGDVTATVDVSNYQIPVTRERLDAGVYEFAYVPVKAGVYTANVFWNDTPVQGSPFQVNILDKSQVKPMGDFSELKDENDYLALTYGQPMTLTFDTSFAGPGVLAGEMLTPKGKVPLDVLQGNGEVKVTLTAVDEGAHHIHLFWGESPLEANPFLAYCPGPTLPLDATKVILEGQGKESARTTIAAEFVVNGRKAGPGVPRVVLRGVNSDIPVTMATMKYDRYRCRYTASSPGSYLLYVYWSDQLIPACPLKVNVTPKGDPRKVKVHGEGLQGGLAGMELYVYVDTSVTGPGDVTANCQLLEQSETCHVVENMPDQYVICLCPAVAEKHTLSVLYDGVDVPGSPFTIRISEPPDPEKVRVFGPGIEDGLIDAFESRFLVDTHGAGSGQLSVKVKGPRGGFRVDMSRESRTERNITCRYDPSEAGEYIIQVRWSGSHVPGSPFHVRLVDSQEQLERVLVGKGRSLRSLDDTWRAEI